MFESGNTRQLGSSDGVPVLVSSSLSFLHCAGSVKVSAIAQAVPSDIWGVEGFARCLSLKDLASLACAQKYWQASIVSVLSSTRGREFVQALEVSLPELARELARKQLTTQQLTAPTPRKLLQQLWTVVSTLQASCNTPWGTAIAAAPGLLEDFTQLFSVPALPYGARQHFVQHLGLHISYKELITAANMRVERVEDWVHCQQTLNIKTDIPDVALAVCCGDRQYQPDQLQLQTRQERENILQLALNSIRSMTASCVAEEVLPLITDPARLLHLLQTALARGHDKVLQIAVQGPAAQHLTAAAVLQLLTEAVEPVSYASAGVLLRCLVKYPAAASISASNLVPLMQVTVRKKCKASIEALCTLPAAQNIPTGDLISMLKQLIGHRPCEAAVRALCSLSAAANLTADDIMPLMSQAAAEYGYSDITIMCSLPAAQQLPLAFYLEMIMWAINESCGRTITALCSLPAASQVDASCWVDLARQALAACSDYKTAILSSMPAAAQVNPADMTSLLKRALLCKQSSSLKALCELPPAQQVAPGDLPGLVQLAEPKLAESPRHCHSWQRKKHHRTSDTLQLLASLQPARHLSAAELLQIVRNQVQLGYSDKAALRIWYKCPAAHSMSVDVLTQHMQDAIQQQNAVLLQALCQIPAARHVRDADSFLQLCDSAVQTSNTWTGKSMLEVLSELPAKYRLSGTQLANVLSAIVQRDMDLVVPLCELPAASAMPVAKVANMLRTAVEYNNGDNVEVLCKMHVTGLLSSRVIEQLLLVAVDLEDEATHCVPPPDVFIVLCALAAAAAAAKITNVGVLLDKAFQRANADYVVQLCQLPAARTLPADALGCYLDKAVRMGDATAVSTLCRLPNAHYIQHQVVTGLMQTAVETDNVNVMPGLCRLRAAHHISPETLLELLQGTAERGCSRRVVLPLVKLVRRVFAFRKYFSKSPESS